MMDTIDVLCAKGQAVLYQERQAKAVADSEQAAARTADRTARIEAVRDGMLDDAEVKAALAKREQKMVDAELQADVERKRVLLEAELFRPFAYYTVHYGVLGVDEDDARMVATETFEALADAPGDDGYWTTVRGQRVKPTFVALIERHEVKTVIDMLSLRWRHRLQRSTEFGSICVAPKVAKVTR